jgi:hypothetical protein
MRALQCGEVLGDALRLVGSCAASPVAVGISPAATARRTSRRVGSASAAKTAAAARASSRHKVEAVVRARKRRLPV